MTYTEAQFQDAPTDALHVALTRAVTDLIVIHPMPGPEQLSRPVAARDRASSPPSAQETD
ncbi:hypothetical protein [Streptomyces sp. NPDC052721]|uniref:hypothetical protein n=1 Tax=Streptomyces sp. NPDC052721 TaxID=3154955 RepID=UPI00343E3D31